MSPGISRSNEETSCFPRVSGDEPMQMRDLTTDALFSPRERG